MTGTKNQNNCLIIGPRKNHEVEYLNRIFIQWKAIEKCLMTLRKLISKLTNYYNNPVDSQYSYKLGDGKMFRQ